MPEAHNNEATLNFNIKEDNFINFLSTYFILNKYESSIKDLKLIQNEANIDATIKSEKETIHEIIKHLLTCIRLTKTGISKETDLNKFIQTLGTLFSFSENKSSTSVAVSIFKSNVERIEEQDPSINIKLIESFLYELKNNFKLSISSFNKLQGDKGRVYTATSSPIMSRRDIMKTLEQEVLEAISEIKINLPKKQALDELDLKNLFLASLLEEETSNEK